MILVATLLVFSQVIFLSKFVLSNMIWIPKFDNLFITFEIKRHYFFSIQFQLFCDLIRTEYFILLKQFKQTNLLYLHAL